MINISQIQFINALHRDEIPHTCDVCSLQFIRTKQQVMDCKRRKLTSDIESWSWNNNTQDVCSKECQHKGQQSGIHSNCHNCQKVIYVRPFVKNKNKNNFCGKSCAAIFNNKNKLHGTRRSKLENYIQHKLQSIYTTLDIHYNRKDAINSELDIFIPSLNIAFELNGIFHYEPIYGDKILNGIQNNDNRKFQACLERNIELCIIDTSNQKYFKEETSKQYLDIIVSIINLKLN